MNLQKKTYLCEPMIKNTTKHIIHEVTPLSEEDCFYIVDRYKTEFTFPLHAHQEFELNFVQNAAGVRRIVGDSIEIIGDYDLVLITGSDLEHVWEQYECQSGNIREITIQFSSELFNSEFMQKKQFKSIHKMLDNAKKGIAFPMEAIMKVYSKLDKLATEQGFYAMIHFLTILHELSQYENYRHLASDSFANANETVNSRRILKVHQYINKNYKEKIELSYLAKMVGMTETSFSRFFKLRTGKSPSEYIINVRLGHATRLLIDSTHSIAEICYQCGFNNLSNFNRIFKSKKQFTPKEFRENYQKTRKLI